uniref:SHSP domain-containing protein n=1 Tax=Lactuca sativa TaxID=4236 RepID=A0A9R1VNH8_LACSA|nr:hypothetical protein LSAT_V11C400226850 [Lactuca sativa]
MDRMSSIIDGGYSCRPQSCYHGCGCGPPANWVKINVRETKDCFEVYALVPGLLREEVISLPSRIDLLCTSTIVSLQGRLLVVVHFEQSNL